MKKLLLLFVIALLFVNSFAFAASDTSESAADGDNLIYNGDFSQIYSATNKPQGWSMDSYNHDAEPEFEIDTNEKDNSNCLHMASSVENDLKAVQYISVEKNTNLKLSCIVKTADISGSGAYISVLNNIGAKSDVVTSDEWTEAYLYVNTGDMTSIGIALRLGYYSELTSGEAWFDDVRVEKAGSAEGDFVILKEYKPTNNTSDKSSTASMPYLEEMISALLVTAAVGIVMYLFMLKKKEKPLSGKVNPRIYLYIMLFAGMVIRIICNYIFKGMKGTYGHSTDIVCFSAWGYKVFGSGPAHFYAPDYFADYPPGYMWILGACDGIRRLFGIDYGTATHALIMKLPSVLCDLAAVALLYHTAVKCGRKPRTALIYAAALAFNPLVIFISSVWGQIDIMLSLFSVLAFIFFMKADEKNGILDYVWSGIMYGIAVALKPQALMIGPMYALVFIVKGINEIKNKQPVKNTVIGAALAAVCAFAMIIIPALPFKGSQEGLWLIDKYAGTASSYNFASVEAYNFFTLLGANWKNADTVFMLGLTYKQVGTIFMAISIIAAVILYIVFCKKNRKNAVYAVIAFMLAGIFTFGHYMHERYLFPAVIFVLFAFVLLNDRRLFISYVAMTVSMLYNSMGAFIITDCRQLDEYKMVQITSYPTFIAIGSCLTIAAFAYFAYTVISMAFETNPQKHSAYSIDITDNNGIKDDTTETDMLEI